MVTADDEPVGEFAVCDDADSPETPERAGNCRAAASGLLRARTSAIHSVTTCTVLFFSTTC